MSNLIQFKRSSTPGKIPLTTDLQFGEVAYNWYDGKLFAKINQGAADAIVDLTANQNITVTGDVTGTGSNAISLTLAATGVGAGTYNNSGTSSTPFTIDAKGRIVNTGAPVTITPAFASITAKPTTLLGYGITDSLVLGSSAGAALGTAGAGTASTAAKSDHTHAMPALDNISNVTIVSKAVNDLLQWNGAAWVNKTVAAVVTPAIIGAVATTAVGAANGVAGLDATGKVPTTQLPASVLGATNYQGVWNATTNTPALATGVGTKGFYYKVSVAGTTSIDGFANWTVGDQIIFNGTAWDVVQGGSSDVSSVFGRVGAVVMLTADVVAALGFTPYNAANPAGYLTSNQNIAVTGDATGSGTNAVSLTLASSGVGAGTYNSSATTITPFTIDAKGRVTNTGAPVTITPAFASLTAKPTTLVGYGITDAMAAGTPIDGGTY